MAAPAHARAYNVALAIVLLALVALTPTTLAQVPAPSIAVKLDQNALSLGAANTTLVNVTVTYTDQIPTAQGSVTLAATVPEGWKATVDPANLLLNAGQSGTFKVTLVAPAAKTGAITGNLDAKATVQAGAGRPSATGSASLALTRVDPIPPPPPNYTPAILLSVLAVALLALGGASFAVSRRNARLEAEAAAAAHAEYMARETGITIHFVDGPLPFGDKREAIYRVAVHNVSDRPRIAVINVTSTPDGWRAAASIPRIPLSAGERVVLSIYVDPAPTAAWGERVEITVSAKPEEAQVLDERVTLDAVAPAVRVPVLDKSAPAVQAREDIRTSRFILRR